MSKQIAVATNGEKKRGLDCFGANGEDKGLDYFRKVLDGVKRGVSDLRTKGTTGGYPPELSDSLKVVRNREHIELGDNDRVVESKAEAKEWLRDLDVDYTLLREELRSTLLEKPQEVLDEKALSVVEKETDHVIWRIDNIKGHFEQPLINEDLFAD